MGKHGEFTVEVSAKDGAVDRITVLDSRETPGMGDVAMEKMTQAIIDNQTLAVDTISGATLTSMAFLAAVGSALDAMGESADDWKNREPAAWVSDVELPEEADVVVIGAGGAGFAAAITAANEGKSVVLMDKMGVFGGDTALSGGEMAVPGNWIQVTQGIEDSPENLVSDMLVGGDNKGDPELVAIIANGALDSANWLTYEGGVSWKHDLMQFGGHNIKRSIIPITHSGSEMTTKLTNRVNGMDDIVLIDNTKAVELVTDDAGAVTGALLYVGDVRLENHGILVNREGDRFVQELDRRDVISNGIKNQTDGVAFLLFDQAAADETGLLKQHADEYENSEARGVIVKADTLDDVAKAQGVDAEELKKTVEKWNQYCADGKDPDFGYSAEMNVIGDGPYYLMACKPAVHYTMGGLHITPEAEVLTVEGTPIAGLYAAGEVAGHKMGTNRLRSCFMTDIYTFGRIAGKNAADYAA